MDLFERADVKAEHHRLNGPATRGGTLSSARRRSSGSLPQRQTAN
jgi:hypothetical protein